MKVVIMEKPDLFLYILSKAKLSKSKIIFIQAFI